jgi:hypothetical protein
MRRRGEASFLPPSLPSYLSCSFTSSPRVAGPRHARRTASLPATWTPVLDGARLVRGRLPSQRSSVALPPLPARAGRAAQHRTSHHLTVSQLDLSTPPHPVPSRLLQFCVRSWDLALNKCPGTAVPRAKQTQISRDAALLRLDVPEPELEDHRCRGGTDGLFLAPRTLGEGSRAEQSRAEQTSKGEQEQRGEQQAKRSARAARARAHRERERREQRAASRARRARAAEAR